MIKLSEENAKKIQRRFFDLDATAAEWIPKWQEIAKYLAPTRGLFDGLPNKPNKVEASVIIDSRPSIALRTLSANLSSGINPPAKRWFKIGLNNKALEKVHSVKAWLALVEDIFYAIFDKSNYYSAVGVEYEETPCFGTGAMLIEEDFKDVIRCRAFTIGEYRIGLGSGNRVNAFSRTFWLPVIELVKEFGEGNVSMAVQAMYKNGDTETQVKCCMLIEPNDDRVVGMVDNKNMPYRCVYWEDGKLQECALRITGYHEFPVVVPRWKTNNSSAIYGYSPAWEALGDIKMLQKIHHRKLLAIEQQVNPTLQKDANVDDDLSYIPGEVVNYKGTDGSGGVRRAFEVNLNLADITAEIAEVENRIDEAFYRNLFMMVAELTGQPRTATEINVRQQEKLGALIHVLQGFKEDLNDPLFERVFNICARTGLLPPPPDELRNEDYHIKYTSTLAQAQKMSGTSALDQLMAFTAGLMQSFPEVRDIIDPDKVLINYSDMVGAPADILRDESVVANTREQRAQAQQQQALEAKIAESAKPAKDLSETKIGEGNTALDEVLGGGMPLGVQ
jgi:hypothetical protein